MIECAELKTNTTMSQSDHIYSNLRPLGGDGFTKPEAAVMKLMQTYPEVMPKNRRNPMGGKVSEYLHQALVTILIFVAFFVLMNWGAITQNISWEVSKATKGTDKANPLYTLVEEKKPTAQEPLPLVKTAKQANTQMPSLQLEVAPPDTRLIIPRINRNVPVINVTTESLIKKDWSKLETQMQEALRSGVIHYPGTARPGQQGNVVITGHSSYFPWDPGRFKDVFAVLHDLEVGDKMLLYFNQQQYIYEVTSIKKVWPSELDVLKPSTENKLTLITCTPVGTNLKRLVVEAKLIKIQS